MLTIGDFRYPPDRYYHQDSHIWVETHGDETATLGIDDFEQEVAGTYQRLMLKEPGEHIDRGDEFVNLESSKFVGAKPAPVGGEIREVNMIVVREPSRINREPYESWLVELDLDDPTAVEDLITGEAIEPWIETEIDEEKERTTLLEDS